MDMETVNTDVLLYRGTPIESLSHEELLQAVRDVFQMYQDERNHHESSMRMWELCRKARISA